MKLLIVDDETSIAELLAEVFVVEGFECDCAYSGNKAIDLIGNNKYDLVISDVKMGDGDGPYLLKHIKDNDLNLPLLFITGHSEFSEEELKDKGALRVFYKPLDLDQFIQEIVQLTKEIK